MAPTTISALVSALGGLTVSGVTRSFTYPPTSLDDADMPAKWVMNPATENERNLSLGAHGGWPVVRASLIVATRSTALAYQTENWSELLTIFNAVDEAIRTSIVGTLGKGRVTWTTRQGFVKVAGADYWAVIAEVTANG